MKRAGQRVDLSRIAQPTLVVSATYDTITPPKSVEALAERVTRGRVHRLKTSHVGAFTPARWLGVLAGGLRTAPAGPCGARAALLSVSASTFLENPTLQDEVFGPSTMVVRCRDHEQALAVARALPGQLTATLHAGPGDGELVPSLLALLEQRAGRVLCGGFPTGVEVCDAMVHGGPYPATTDSRSTSVGTGAITRFTRPVAYQNFPEELLPEELRDDAPQGLQRLVDGAWQRSG